MADERGYRYWQSTTEDKEVSPAATAIVLCDVWDNHHCRGAVERLEKMLPRMNQVLRAARDQGMQIVHAPSETMPFYADHPARQRVLAAPSIEIPSLRDLVEPPLPIDASDGGDDTGGGPGYKAWTRQHPAIDIDSERDIISDNGPEILTYLLPRGIEQLIIFGVHTNMCILNRTFAIKAMVKRGVPIALVRDLTDTMYNPARPPYVSHAEGTRLTVEFIEKFWCPTILSSDILEG